MKGAVLAYLRYHPYTELVLYIKQGLHEGDLVRTCRSRASSPKQMKRHE